MKHSSQLKYISIFVGFLLVSLIFGYSIRVNDTANRPSSDLNMYSTEVSAAQLPTSRDPLTWPFAQNSIWNAPIGSGAEYVDAKIDWVEHATVDVDHFYVLNADDPLRPVYAPGNWGPGRPAGYEYRNIALPLADDFFCS